MVRPFHSLFVLVLCLFACVTFGVDAQAQSEGQVSAVTWAGNDTPESAELLTPMRSVSQPPKLNQSRGQNAAQFLNDQPAGRRYLLLTQVGNYIAQDGWVSYRDNPHDRTEATTLTENISGENRTSIAVKPMPYGLSDGHELIIQTGDPSNPPLERLSSSRTGDGRKYEGAIFAYVDGEVSSGDTTIPIHDGNGNSVTVTASSGDRILSDFQGLWPDHAREEIRKRLGEFMRGFVNEGGELDGITLDTELGIPATKGIKHDPRWGDATEGINGVSFKERLAPVTIDEVMNARGGSSPREKWSKVVDHRVKEHNLNDAVFEEVKNDYPDIFATDWNHSGISETNKFPNLDSKPIWHPSKFGTHANYGLYASIRNLSRDKLGAFLDNPLPYSYGDSPFATVRWQTKFARTMYRENEGKVQPWITYESLSDGFYFLTVDGTPYYEEYLRHVALHTDSETPLLYFNPHGDDAASDQQDLNVNSVFAEVNDVLDGQSFTLHTTGEIDWQSEAVVTAVDLPTKRLWRVTVKRVDPHDDRSVTVNVSNGDSFKVSGEEVGAWYESDLNEDLTFSYTHPPVENLYPSEDFQGLGTGMWTGPPAPDLMITRSVSDSKGGSQAIHVEQACCDYQMPDLLSPEVPVAPNSNYVFSFWATGGANVEVVKSSTGGRMGREDLTSDVYKNGWGRHRLTFETGDNTSGMRVKFSGAFPDFRIARPMLNKNKNMAPYMAPDEQAGTTQSIPLQEGWNLASTFVQPSDSDLEAVLGDAVSTIAQVENESGQLFDPSDGTNGIGTWNVSEAYKIYAEEPTSFVVEGTALNSAEVSLDEGWNWLPYLDDTSVAIDQALEPIQNDLVMVKDEVGRVYRPAQNTDQIGTLEPGTAYKILLESPVTLTYPLE